MRAKGTTLLPPLYAVADAEVCARAGRPLLDVTRAFLDGGATLIQLRAKAWTSGAILDAAREMVRLAGAAARVIVNDRADVAAIASAAGVHVGQDDLSPEDARRLVGPGAIVGVSTHSREQLVDALTRPITYVAVGPVFGSTTKATGYDAVGLTFVETAAALAAPRGVPVVAIGGITLARAPRVLAAGANSVCVISDLMVGDPRERVKRFLDVLKRSGSGQP